MKRILCMLSAVFLLAVTLTACGDTESSEEQDIEALSANTYRSATVHIRNLDEVYLVGTWDAERDEEGRYFEVTIDGDMTNIYYFYDSTVDVCWVGTAEESATTGFTSERFEDYVMDYDNKEIEFVLDNDVLSFEHEDEDGKVETVELVKTSDGILNMVHLNEIYHQEIPDDDEEEKKSDKSETAVNTSPKISVSDITEPILDSGTNQTVGENTDNSSGTAVATCSHTYGVGQITKEPTCTEPGVRTYTCTKCGDIRTESIPATGHNYESEVTKEPTCGTVGIQVYTCTACGDSYQVNIPATGDHEWEDVTTMTETEEQGHYETVENSIMSYRCDTCGYTSQSMSDVQSHIQSVHSGVGTVSQTETKNETEVWVIDTPAQTKEVVTGRVCSVCGATE